MQLSGALLYYWIRKTWPKAVRVAGLSKRAPRVGRTMFWGSPQEMRGRFVILDRAQVLHIDRRYPDTIFLCLDNSVEGVDTHGNECIFLPGEQRIAYAFNRMGDIFDRFSRWDDQLDQAVHTFLSYDAIVRSCDVLIDDPMALIDSDFRYVSYSKRLAMDSGFEDRYVDKDQQLTLEAVNMLTAAADFASLESHHDVFNYVGNEAMLHMNVFSDGAYIGRLALPQHKERYINDYYSDVLRIVAASVEELYGELGSFFRDSKAHANFRKFMSDFCEGAVPSRAVLIPQLEEMGYRSTDTFCLVQILQHSPIGSQRINSVLCSHIEGLWPQGTCFIAQDKCFLLLNKTRQGEDAMQRFAQEFIVFLRESLMVAAVSRDFNDFLDLPYACRQTDIALEVGRAADPMYWCFYFDSYAFLYLVEHGFHGFMPHHVCAPALALLQSYDKENGTDLFATLRTFIETQYNAQATAKELFLARSTLIKRLARIKEVAGVSLDSLEERTYLALSYQIFDQYASYVSL